MAEKIFPDGFNRLETPNGNTKVMVARSSDGKPFYMLLGDIVPDDVDLSRYQVKLVSGENLRTVNGQSLLGNEDLVIEGGSAGPVVVKPWTIGRYKKYEVITFNIDGIDYIFQSKEDGNEETPAFPIEASWIKDIKSDISRYKPAQQGGVYQTGELVYQPVNSSGVDYDFVYRSKVDNNTGNYPLDIDSQFWEYVGNLFPNGGNYVPGAAYKFKDVVKDTNDGNQIYISNKANNEAPLSAQGTLKKWKLLGAKAVNTTNIEHRMNELEDDLNTLWYEKQGTLESGVNIKTVNGVSLLGSGDVPVSGGGGVSLGETSSTAYRGDRGKIAYDHAQVTSGNPHGTTKADIGLGSVDNTSDANKPVSTDQQSALDLKELKSNKQNSLTPDGSGVKYPTVDAVNTISNGLIHASGNETKNGRLTLNSPNGADNITSATSSVSPLVVLGGNGGNATGNGAGFTGGGNSSSITIIAGNGGSSIGVSTGTNAGGNAGGVRFVGGDGGRALNGATNADGIGGSFEGQGGNSWGNGVPGSANLKGGNAFGANNRGGDVFIVPGYGNNTDTDASTYNGAIFMAASPDKTHIRGRIVMGSFTDDGVNRLQVTGNSNFTGKLKVTLAPVDDTDVIRLIELNLKSDIAATQVTSTALTFTKDCVSGTVEAPITGDISGVITNAALGVVMLVIHNSGTAPTFDNKFKKLSGSGNYVSGQINYIYCQYIDATTIIYSINQVV